MCVRRRQPAQKPRPTMEIWEKMGAPCYRRHSPRPSFYPGPGEASVSKPKPPSVRVFIAVLNGHRQMRYVGAPPSLPRQGSPADLLSHVPQACCDSIQENAINLPVVVCRSRPQGLFMLHCSNF